MTDYELKKLLGKMSLEEKADQLMQLRGTFYQKEAKQIVTGPEGEALGLTEEMVQNAGSVLSIYGADQLIKIQKEYMEKQPHHIPLLFMMDVIHGLKTIFPIPLGMAAAFEPELMERCASAAAREAAVSGLHVVFSPMADMVRDARWGRVMEATGEDPYLNDLYARAQVKGYQGTEMKKAGKVCACVKHFAGYGAAEAGREYHYGEIDEYTLMDRYMTAYEGAIKEGAGMVMTSFNSLNGVPSSVNKWLLKNILRDKMEFEGVVISDYSAIEETITAGICADKYEAACKALQAGVDIDMMTGVYAGALPELLKKGVIEESAIDESVMRILKLKDKLGLFENPYKDADPKQEKEIILCKEHRELAREAAVKSFVLLKNEEQILPLKDEKIAFIGPYVDRKEMLSNWSVAGDTKDCVTIKEAILEACKKEQVVFCQGSTVFEDTEITGAFEVERDGIASENQLEEMKKDALETAKWADTVVLCLGEHFRQSGEAASRGMLDIPKAQMKLLREIAKVNKKIVVVLFNGRPLDLREVSDLSKAILEVWLPGSEGGHAIADVLLGKKSPTGKLTMSFPYCVGQAPMSYNEYRTGRPAEKVEYGRYCSKYIDIPNTPLYSFGYGLTYTEFEMSPIILSCKEMMMDTHIKASVWVKNIGNREGIATVQLYIGDLAASVIRPVKELKGFQKVKILPGEKKMVTFLIDEKMLRFYHPKEGWKSEKGSFMLWIGEDSRTDNRIGFDLV